MTAVPFHVPVANETTLSALLYPADPNSSLDVLFVLAHGAGGGQTHPFMVRYAHGLADCGIHVVTFNFPYMEAGRRAPDRPPVLEEAFRRVIVAAVSRTDAAERKLFIGGKSMGGRIATHVAAASEQWPDDATALNGVIVFGYPLKPPGGPSKRSPDRTSHLARIEVPLLIVQGTRDSFGGPAAIETAIQTARANENPAGEGQASRKGRRHQVLSIDGADHSLAARFDQTVFEGVIGFLSAT